MTSVNAHPDHQRIIEAGLQAGNQAPLREIYREVAPEIIAALRAKGAQLSEARDIFQEAMIVLVEKATDPRFVLTAPVGAFLRGVCHRMWLSRLRQNNRRAEVSLDGILASPSEGPDLGLEEGELNGRCFRLLDQCFNQLSDTCRALLLRLKKGLSPAEIAEQLGMSSRNTFDRRKFACIQRWRGLIQAADPQGICQQQLL